ncbi:Mitochondrial import inner membrane translocase subunit Tim8 A [Habropoda laboriosa]|uniref:Mitochondrial import inner membrane translocase subunit n=1 Tax=Habropoda laboriosa TaxID=597456 RepID=A0A0L7R905_9HYME|nr:PREDICTED: mitochondrial import inner membrane translocase subunit Tim8 A-like [Habropoda laboriosa]KOC67334.1 Mitochondrial import inner membrane translocase subunit Tim8 A [Habropoda laboriosa]
MRFMEEQRSKGAVDEQFQAFIEPERKNQRFQTLAQKLTEICWELCVETLGRSLDSRTHDCLVNCLNCFIDINNFMAYRVRNMVLVNPKKMDVEQTI